MLADQPDGRQCANRPEQHAEPLWLKGHHWWQGNTEGYYLTARRAVADRLLVSSGAWGSHLQSQGCQWTRNSCLTGGRSSAVNFLRPMNWPHACPNVPGGMAAASAKVSSCTGECCQALLSSMTVVAPSYHADAQCGAVCCPPLRMYAH